MSNATLKKRRQKKSTRTSNSKKLKYSVKPMKVNKDIKWKVIEGRTKIISVFDFEDEAQDLADFQNKNQVWLPNGGIPNFLCYK